MTIDLSQYAIGDPDRILTPALLIYPRFVDSNIDATLRAMNGNAGRWRPHLKTSKMPWVIRRLIARGVSHFKVSTTRELLVACECGAEDVLVAYPVVGANARRVLQIAALYPETRVSVLVENPAQMEPWRSSRVGIFIDVNPGMDRTGIEPDAVSAIAAMARLAGDRFRGIHFYDGHVHREAEAYACYDRLLNLIGGLDRAGVRVAEAITSGSPAFPYAMAYPGFRNCSFTHRASPGTILFNDTTSLSLLPPELGYQPAALVLATVVSHPAPRRLTCNAGHKSVSADAGVPTCAVIGHPRLQALKPSEEHLPLAADEGSEVPPIGMPLYLLPRHICPSVNNFDEALLVRDGIVESLELIQARGHESPWIGV